MQNSADIIEKWYRKLKFPSSFDPEFYDMLKTVEIPESICIDTYDMQNTDGKYNLLSFLYMCQSLERRYSEKGLGEDVLLDTLSDLVRWTETWSELKNTLYLGQLSWVSIPFKMEIFKLGRLQFCMQKAGRDVPAYGLKKDDNILGIHIPAGEALTLKACEDSLQRAKAFFATYYPEYSYDFFFCHSWLLDTMLENILSADSNILRFQKLFDIVTLDESDAIIRYVLRWGAERKDVIALPTTTEFSKKVRNHILSGGKFYEGVGIIPKDRIQA